MEECAEVTHIAAKQIQFGKDSTNKGKLAITNSEHLANELADLFAVVRLLQLELEIPVRSGKEFKIASQAKKLKMQKYLNESTALGYLPEIKL